jgi:hypothetical protein
VHPHKNLVSLPQPLLERILRQESYDKIVEFCTGMFPSHFVSESDDLILILGCALKRASRTYPENGRAVGRLAHIHKKPLEQPVRGGSRVPNIAANHGAANFRWKLESGRELRNGQERWTEKSRNDIRAFYRSAEYTGTEVFIEIFLGVKRESDCLREPQYRYPLTTNLHLPECEVKLSMLPVPPYTLLLMSIRFTADG